MTLSLVLLAVLAYAPEAAAPSGAPPQQAVAIIDGDGTLRITQVVSGGFGAAVNETEVPVGPMDKPPVMVKVKVTSVQLSTSELPAKYVDAYTVDGAAIPREKLAEMLTKERAVLVAIDGKKIDSFHLQLYKEGTIVLVPPANTLGGGAYGVVGPFPGGPFVQPPLPNLPPLPPFPNFPKPIEDKKP